MDIAGMYQPVIVDKNGENPIPMTNYYTSLSENVNENINIYIINNHYREELKNIIISWLDYKDQRNENYQEQGFKSLLTQIKNNVDKFGESKVIEIIKSSMSSNYKGIIWDKLKEQKSSGNQYRSNYERSQEALERARRELDNG